MKFSRISVVALLLCAMVSALFAQEAVVSKKQDVAVFALGYYGYSIPADTLATVDSEIQSVFVNLGRFNVLGQAERLSSNDVNTFINTLRSAKENNTPLPDEIKFGEVQLTEAVLQKLYGAFIVVVPTVTSYTSEYNRAKGQWETNLATSVAFINVAEGTTFGYATINTSGSSKETQSKSIRSALSGISGQLEFKIRSIPVFQISTRVLDVTATTIRMQLGQDMGIRKGDEYAVIEKTMVGDFEDERESGLVVIREVGPKVSTGTIMYAPSSLSAGAQLKEIPRSGTDASLYVRGLAAADGSVKIGAGIRLAWTRGFYTFRPIVDARVYIDDYSGYATALQAGGEFQMYIRRLGVYGNIAVGGSAPLLLLILSEEYSNTDDGTIFTHLGGSANVGVSYLLSRDMRFFVEAGFEYWYGLFSGINYSILQSYGGASVAAGLTFKL